MSSALARAIDVMQPRALRPGELGTPHAIVSGRHDRAQEVRERRGSANRALYERAGTVARNSVRCPASAPDQRPHEQLERHHRRDGVAGQPDPARIAEPCRSPSGAPGRIRTRSIRISAPSAAQHCPRVVVIAHGDAARRDQHVEAAVHCSIAARMRRRVVCASAGGESPSRRPSPPSRRSYACWRRRSAARRPRARAASSGTSSSPAERTATRGRLKTWSSIAPDGGEHAKRGRVDLVPGVERDRASREVLTARAHVHAGVARVRHAHRGRRPRSVSSMRTTESAPSGIGAPVMMRAASPSPIVRVAERARGDRLDHAKRREADDGDAPATSAARTA